MCSNCGKRIGKERLHTHPVGSEEVFCGCIAAIRTGPIHARLYQWCPHDWHDLWDHELLLFTDRRTAVWYHEHDRFTVRDDLFYGALRSPRGGHTALSLVGCGLCTPQCLVASPYDGKVEECDCRCGGEYHGRLADAEVTGWFHTTIEGGEAEEAAASETGVRAWTMAELMESSPLPTGAWPMFPHCPNTACRRRLSSKGKRPVIGPTADRKCPHCGTALDPRRKA